VRDWARVYGLQTVVFRHSSIYGGRQFASFDQGWIGWFCQKAFEQHRSHRRGLSHEPFTISGSGKQVRDVLIADDLIRLYQAAYEARESISGEIFNIGGGSANSLRLLELFAHPTSGGCPCSNRRSSAGSCACCSHGHTTVPSRSPERVVAPPPAAP